MEDLLNIRRIWSVMFYNKGVSCFYFLKYFLFKKY